MSKKLTFIDMFAGIGGFRSGMEKVGHKCVGWIEWDKFARQSYQAMYNTEGEYNAKDIRTVKGSDLPGSDVWCFGFPCQDVSNAGKQAGLLNGKRSGLFFEVVRLLQERAGNKETLPKTLFIENVKNLLSIDGGWGFARMQIELDKAGYDTEWSVINSAEVVPQNRERAYIIGHFRGSSSSKVFPIVGNASTPKPKSMKVLGNLSATGHHAENVLDDKGLATTLTASSYKHVTKVAVHQVGNISKTDSFGGNPQVGRVYATDGLAPTLNTMQGGGREPKILYSHDEIKQVASSVKKYANVVRPNDKPIVRITDKKDIRGSRQDSKKSGLSELQFTNPGNKSNTVTASHAPKTWDKELRIRKLTPLECWRLQGFDDEQFYKAKAAGLSNTQLYKQAGNSVTVPVIKAIAERL